MKKKESTSKHEPNKVEVELFNLEEIEKTISLALYDDFDRHGVLLITRGEWNEDISITNISNSFNMSFSSWLEKSFRLNKYSAKEIELPF